jgi:hypothetical protein
VNLIYQQTSITWSQITHEGLEEMKQNLKLRIFEFSVIIIIVLVIVLGFTMPYYSIRLSLITNGHPFAEVIAKEKIQRADGGWQTNIFQHEPMNNLRAGAVAFAKGKAIGWIYYPLSGIPRFVPFGYPPNLDWMGFDPIYDIGFILLYVARWPCVMACTIVLLLREYRKRKHRIRHAGTKN